MKIRISKLDKLFARYIKLRDKICQRCGGKGSQTSHFHSRRKKSVRWNPDNACLLCFGCHLYFGGNPLEHTEWFRKRLGEEKFELLNIQANMVGVGIDENAITLYLQEQIAELEAEDPTKYWD